MRAADTEASAGGARRDGAGLAVHLSGVVHLYRQSGADVVALRGIDLDVEPGEMVALLGPSGMGKTTVLRVMAGIVRPSAGSVRVGSNDLVQLTAAQRRGLLAGEVSYIVQGANANVLPFATPLENLWFAQQGARSHRRTVRWQPEDLLEAVNLTAFAHDRLAELPRGIQQQVAVAAGVAAGPRLVLADEPTSQLGADAGAGVVHLLERVNAMSGTTVVIVTHDPSIAGLFPRTVTIRDGRVGAEGRRGEQYSVVDGSGSVQLPPDVLKVLPPNSRVRVIRKENGVELRSAEDEP